MSLLRTNRNGAPNKFSQMPPNPNTVIAPHITFHGGSTLASSFYYSERFRLDTFSNFPNAFMDKGKLAAAGFYYTKTRDVVRCAFCRVEVGSWEPGDDPFVEHKKWAKQCPFLNSLEVRNMPLNPSDPSSDASSDPSSVPSSAEPRGVDECGLYGINPIGTSLSVGSLERLGVIRTVRAQHLRFVNLEDRLKSFESWPMALQPRPEALASAGFFYTGQGDRCVCYQCGGGLKDWSESDDPWLEHGKFFPLCNHVILNKGQDFINSCRDTITTTQSTASTPSSNTPPILDNITTITPNISSIDVSQTTSTLSTPTTASESTSESTSSHVEEGASCSQTEVTDPQLRCKERSEEAEKLVTILKCTNDDTKGKSEALMCKICFQNERSVAFLRCGHAIACEKCASLLKNCAICREEVIATVKIYLS